jgi:hypothetical protein
MVYHRNQRCNYPFWLLPELWARPWPTLSLQGPLMSVLQISSIKLSPRKGIHQAHATCSLNPPDNLGCDRVRERLSGTGEDYDNFKLFI